MQKKASKYIGNMWMVGLSNFVVQVGKMVQTKGLSWKIYT